MICSIQDKLCDHNKTANVIPCIYCILKGSNMCKFAAAETKRVMLLFSYEKKLQVTQVINKWLVTLGCSTFIQSIVFGSIYSGDFVLHVRS